MGVYQLDRARVHRALERGATFASIIRFFEKATNDALPRRVVQTLQDWAQEIERIRIRRVTLLETRDRATLEQLTRVRAIRERLNRTLSPRVVTLREHDVSMLIRQLQRNGYPPRVELPRDAILSADGARTRPFDHPTLAHLYLAASIGHHLPELIPAHYRVPYSVVLELEKQLTERDYGIAAQVIEDLLTDRRPSPTTVGATLRGRPSAVSIPPLAVIETLERAIDASAPLHITYYAASHDETSTRVKHQSEWITAPDFHILIRAILRRVSSLYYFHCDEQWEADYRDIIARAQAVKTTHAQTRWGEWERYSARQDKKIELGGFVGEASYTGNLESFLPLLLIGQLAHVGKAYVFGNGQYECDVVKR